MTRYLRTAQIVNLTRCLTALAFILTVATPAHAALCDAPGWQPYVTGAVEFATGGPDTRVVTVQVGYQPVAVTAIAIDEQGATDSTISAEAFSPERDGRGYVIRVALKSRLVDEPDYRELVSALVCVRRY